MDLEELFELPISELQHAGVKGMKWGVRKSRVSSAQKSEWKDNQKKANVKAKEKYDRKSKAGEKIPGWVKPIYKTMIATELASTVNDNRRLGKGKEKITSEEKNKRNEKRLKVAKAAYITYSVYSAHKALEMFGMSPLTPVTNAMRPKVDAVLNKTAGKLYAQQAEKNRHKTVYNKKGSDRKDVTGTRVIRKALGVG